MRAVVYDGPGDFSVSTVPTPEPRRGEVLIAVSQVGLCGTDAHIHHGEYGAVFPLIPGHEMTGTVVVLGEGVTRFQVGESVTVNPNIACGRCSYCCLVGSSIATSPRGWVAPRRGSLPSTSV